MTAPWAPSRTRSRDPTRSWAARGRPRGTTRWRRASSSQSWAGGTPTAVPDIAERHCLSIGTSPPVPAFLLPSHLPERGGGLETFPPLLSPSLLTKRWLSASNLGITATSSSAITPRQEGDISQPNIFFSSGRRGLDLRESHRFLHKRMLQPLPHPCSLGGNGFQLLCTSTSLMVSAPATPRGSVKSHRDRRFPWSPLLGCRGAAIPNSSFWGSRTCGEGSPPSTAKAWADQAVSETPSHRLPNLPNLSYGGWSRTSTAGTRGSLAHPEPFCAQPGAPGTHQEPSTLSQ